MNRKIATLICAVIVSGCAGSPYDIARKHEALRDFKGSDGGIVVASVGTSTTSLFAYSNMTFRRKGTEDLFSFGFSRGSFLIKKTPDFETSDAAGNVVVIKLPPGAYEMVTAVAGQYGQYGYQCSLKLPPIVSFTLDSGETAYLGRYLVDRGRCLSLLISDEEASDIAIAKTRPLSLPLAPIHSFVPERESRRF